MATTFFKSINVSGIAFFGVTNLRIFYTNLKEKFLCGVHHRLRPPGFRLKVHCENGETLGRIYHGLGRLFLAWCGVYMEIVWNGTILF